VSTIYDGDVEWDEKKARTNLEKHGVSFEEAATVLADPSAVYFDDGGGTGRIAVVGVSAFKEERILYVVTVERHRGERITSARKAGPREMQIYRTGREAP